MIKKFKEKRKEILCVHDCFGVEENEVEEIEKTYIEVFKKGEEEIRLENYYKKIVEEKVEIKGVRKKARLKVVKEWEEVIKLSKERKVKWAVEKNSNLLKNE